MSTSKTIKLIREIPEIPGFEFVGWEEIRPGEDYLAEDNTIKTREYKGNEFSSWYGWKFKAVITPIHHYLRKYPISLFNPSLHPTILAYGSGKFLICLRRITDNTYENTCSSSRYSADKLSRDFTHFTSISLEDLS